MDSKFAIRVRGLVGHLRTDPRRNRERMAVGERVEPRSPVTVSLQCTGKLQPRVGSNRLGSACWKRRCANGEADFVVPHRVVPVPGEPHEDPERQHECCGAETFRRRLSSARPVQAWGVAA